MELELGDEFTIIELEKIKDSYTNEYIGRTKEVGKLEINVKLLQLSSENC